MDTFTPPRRRRRGLAAFVISGLVVASFSIGGAALAAGSGSAVLPVSSAVTPAWSNGKTVSIQYPQNFFCDTSVPSGAAGGCEVGTAANVGPVGNANRSVLFVLVPLFAKPSPAPMCGAGNSNNPCPNHPLNIDLSQIAGALGVTSASTLANVPLPAHSHILDGNAGGWWQVKVVAVTNQTAWAQLAAGKSQAVMDSLIATGSGVLGPIPTNLYLFFNVVGHK